MTANHPTPFEYHHTDTQALSPLIHLGTSSWTHPFWKGQLYHRTYSSEKEFNLHSLAEFSAYPLFRIVEIDSTFYTPPKEETLANYAALVPDDFRFSAKIWERLSIPTFPNVKRYGKYAGQENLAFLDSKIFLDEFVPPFRNATFSKKFASFLLQFPKMDPVFITSRHFLNQLEKFLDAFPKEFSLAIEIRNREGFQRAYIELLNRYHVTHCFNQWHTMPALIDQMKKIATFGGLGAPFYMARLITPLGVSYEAAKGLFEPFYEIKRRSDAARNDIVRFVRRAIERNVPAYIIVNNRFEGNSPCTVRELDEMLRREVR
jgi:uncharacterized protein YecE (DUF72 family)